MWLVTEEDNLQTAYWKGYRPTNRRCCSPLFTSATERGCLFLVDDWGFRARDLRAGVLRLGALRGAPFL